MKITKFMRRGAQSALTVLKHFGLPCKRYGYYTPYPFAKDLTTPKYLYPLKNIAGLFEAHLEDFKMILNAAQKHNDVFKNFSQSSKFTPLAPRFNQDWFCGIDGAAAYTLVRQIKPKNIVDIGSGYSTRFLAQAAQDEGIKTFITGVNPKLMRGADKVCSKFYNCTLDKVPRGVFAALGAGDILFVDSSHLLMPGTDLELLFLDILPALKKGVYIHFHDIFLPHNYPQDEDWGWWAFNEQQFVAVLLSGGAYKPVFASAYLQNYHPQLLGALYAPVHPRGHQSSLWLLKQV